MEKVTLRKLFEIGKFPFLNRIKKEAAVDLSFFCCIYYDQTPKTEPILDPLDSLIRRSSILHVSRVAAHGLTSPSTVQRIIWASINLIYSKFHMFNYSSYYRKIHFYISIFSMYYLMLNCKLKR